MAYSSFDRVPINDWIDASSIDCFVSPVKLTFPPSKITETDYPFDLRLHYFYAPPKEDIFMYYDEDPLGDTRDSAFLSASPARTPSKKSKFDECSAIPHTPTFELEPECSPDLHFNLSPLTFRQLNDIQGTPFSDRYQLSTPRGDSVFSISPVLRASSKTPSNDQIYTPASGDPVVPFFLENTRFLNRLHALDDSSTDSSPERPLAEIYRKNTSSPSPQALRSPYKTVAPLSIPYNKLGTVKSSGVGPSPDSLSVTITPTRPFIDSPRLSPLTPLTPKILPNRLQESDSRDRHISTRTRCIKRKLISLDSPSPLPLPKKCLRSLRLSHRERPVTTPETNFSPFTTPPSSPCLPPVPAVPTFTTRAFPSSEPIEISPNFPLFYRRFPASSFFQPPTSESPCHFSKVRHPGGIYNPPRWPLDLYTPRFVKGKGAEKVGLCPICIERPDRGGEGKKLWLAMKFSAFKCTFFGVNIFQTYKLNIVSYHMQYAHGISASTGRPYSPPTAFRTVERPSAAKKERREMQEGKCHKCVRWIPIEGIKDVESKVKELFWWKHAAICHQNSTLESEEDVYEKDETYEWLVNLSSG